MMTPLLQNDNHNHSSSSSPKQECPGLVCTMGAGRCVPKKKICDGIVDCLGAEDEIGCTHRNYHKPKASSLSHMIPIVKNPLEEYLQFMSPFRSKEGRLTADTTNEDKKEKLHGTSSEIKNSDKELLLNDSSVVKAENRKLNISNSRQSDNFFLNDFDEYDLQEDNIESSSTFVEEDYNQGSPTFSSSFESQSDNIGNLEASEGFITSVGGSEEVLTSGEMIKTTIEMEKEGMKLTVHSSKKTEDNLDNGNSTSSEASKKLDTDTSNGNGAGIIHFQDDEDNLEDAFNTSSTNTSNQTLISSTIIPPRKKGMGAQVTNSTSAYGETLMLIPISAGGEGFTSELSSSYYHDGDGNLTDSEKVYTNGCDDAIVEENYFSSSFSEESQTFTPNFGTKIDGNSDFSILTKESEETTSSTKIFPIENLDGSSKSGSKEENLFIQESTDQNFDHFDSESFLSSIEDDKNYSGDSQNSTLFPITGGKVTTSQTLLSNEKSFHSHLEAKSNVTFITVHKNLTEEVTSRKPIYLSNDYLIMNDSFLISPIANEEKNHSGEVNTLEYGSTSKNIFLSDEYLSSTYGAPYAVFSEEILATESSAIEQSSEEDIRIKLVSLPEVESSELIQTENKSHPSFREEDDLIPIQTMIPFSDSDSQNSLQSFSVTYDETGITTEYSDHIPSEVDYPDSINISENCEDGSDEWNCSCKDILVSSKKNMFICDGILDCGDLTDESKC
ncbi:hypothetical protein J437_LFUL013064, partial [Ladona fulva]